jgi:hypothetical protein
MRCTASLLILLLLLIAVSAQAVSISFGQPVDRSTCSEIRHSDCSYNFSRLAAQTFLFRGQAAANSIPGHAVADLRVIYDIPYSLSRDVTVVPLADGAAARVERVSIRFDVDYIVLLKAIPDLAQIGGVQSAQAFSASVRSLGGYFGDSIPGASVSGSQLDLVDGRLQMTFTPGLNESGPRASEAETDSLGLPADFRAWEDSESPSQADYSQPFTFTQTFDDVLRVSFRMLADSQRSGFLSVNGGGATACAGLGNDLLIERVDDTDCDTPGLGLGVEATVRSNGSFETIVKAPSATVLPSIWENEFGAVLPLVSSADDDFEDVALSFSFPFAGSTYSSLSVNSNGGLVLGGEGYLDYDIWLDSDFEPDFSALGAPTLAVLGTDLAPGFGGEVRFNDFGDRAVITWLSVASFTESDGELFFATFQVQLRDDGSIVYGYGDIFGDPLGLSQGIVVGITQGDGATPPASVDLSASPGLLSSTTIHEIWCYNEDPSDDPSFSFCFEPGRPNNSGLDLEGTNVIFTPEGDTGFTVTALPEPGSGLLAAATLATLAGIARRRPERRTRRKETSSPWRTDRLEAGSEGASVVD